MHQTCWGREWLWPLNMRTTSVGYVHQCAGSVSLSCFRVHLKNQTADDIHSFFPRSPSHTDAWKEPLHCTLSLWLPFKHHFWMCTHTHTHTCTHWLELKWVWKIDEARLWNTTVSCFWRKLIKAWISLQWFGFYWTMMNWIELDYN